MIKGTCRVGHHAGWFIRSIPYFKIRTMDRIHQHGGGRVHKYLSDGPESQRARDPEICGDTLLHSLHTLIMAQNPPTVDDLLSRNRYVVFSWNAIKDTVKTKHREASMLKATPKAILSTRWHAAWWSSHRLSLVCLPLFQCWKIQKGAKCSQKYPAATLDSSQRSTGFSRVKVSER